jgi:hypothetical protein
MVCRVRSIVVLLCVAIVLLATNAAAAREPTPPAAPDASLSGTNGDAERTMQGLIGPQSHDLIVKWLRANPHRDLTLHVDSRGGRAAFDVRLYDAIEAHGHVTTDVGPGEVCLSACAYLWLAGRVRTVADRAMLGFHSAFCVGPCDDRGVGIVNQSLLDILARTEPALAVLVSNTGAMISGNHLIALARRENGHWAMRTFQPSS